MGTTSTSELPERIGYAWGVSPRLVVAFNNFAAADVTLELEAVRRVLDSGRLILGDEVRCFEEAWAERCGVNYAVGVGNGLDAIEIGLRANGIGAGDEVITTPMTAVATVLAIIRAGATPVLADIDPETGLLDPSSVERCIGPKTRAVLLVHLYGQMRAMERWIDLCQAHDILLLEDCAQLRRLMGILRRLQLLSDQEPWRRRRCRHARHAGPPSGRPRTIAAQLRSVQPLRASARGPQQSP